MPESVGFVEQIFNAVGKGLPSLPILIGVILFVAFIAMLAVTIVTLISLKRAEIKAQKVIELPPSAIKDDGGGESVTSSNDDECARMPFPFGARLNNFLIDKGYIRVHSVVKSFFKALDFMKDSLGVGYKYKLPWFLMIGTEESGKSSMLGGFTHDEILDEDDADITWWFLRGGIILDVKGNVFLPKDGFRANDRSWNVTLEMLTKYRSERPLNGIILTIPANEIYGKNKLSIEVIRKRAQYVARKLHFAQNFLGLKLPIYIVVSKTDLIPGFQSLCTEIPVRNRNNMLGWSCPYSLESVYSPRWLDEAFESIEDELNEIRMEIFSDSGATTTRDGIFVFPSELLTVKEGLAAYTDSIFRTGTVEERFYLRGIYFAGDSKMVSLLPFTGENPNGYDVAIVGTPDADVNEAGSLTPSLKNEELAPKKIFFFEDLIFKKVFMEDGIASPIRSKIYQSNKSITIAKISTAAFILIGSYGLFSAKDRLIRSKDILYPSLSKVASIIKDAGTLTMQNLENRGNEILSECTVQLLTMMQQLHNVRFSSIFVPASWFSSINEELTETLRSSYQRVVVRTIYMNLILKARHLLSLRPTSSDVSTSIKELLNPYNSKEYKLLKSYVCGLIELENNIKKFDSLRSSGDPRDLKDLVDYTFQGDLPKEFMDKYDQFRRILMNTPFPPIDLSPYKKVAYEVLLNLFQNYVNAIFSDRKEGNIVSFLNKFIDSINKQNIGKIPDCRFVRKFAKDLSSVCKELGDEGKTWLDNDYFKSDAEYDAFLDNVELLFGKDTAQQLLDTTVIHFGYLKRNIEEFNKLLESDIPSSFRDKDEEPQPLSRGIFRMEHCLATFCSEPYMREPSKYKLVTNIPTGKMIYWDDELIQYAYNIGKRFEQFFSNTIKEFPRSMQEGIALLGKSNLCAVIAGIVAKAQSFIDAPTALTDELTSEEILQKQVTELKGVAPKFVSLMKIMRDDSVSFVFSDLRTLLNRIGFSLLDHIDKLLDNQKPYMPQNLSFRFWQGDMGVANLAYSAADNEEMLRYLILQRKNISRLALEFATPIVQLLNSDVIFDQNFGNHGQLTKWSRIVDAVKGFQARDPANSVSALEHFVLRTLNTYDLDNVTSEIDPKGLKGESGDYFLNIIKQITKGIMERAEVLIRQRNINRYKKLRNFYNKHLEGKYPFANYSKTKRTATDAELETTRQFFAMYDEFGGTPEKILDQIHQLDEVAEEPYKFLKTIHDLRTFWGNFVHTQHEAPKVTLEADFEINKQGENNTKYLMDRIFKPNNDSNIESISDNKKGTWYFGSPIKMVFRWANSEDPTVERPVYNVNDPDQIVEDSTATIECVGNWAALRFLQKYKASEGANTGNLLTNQNLLVFNINLNNGRIAKIYVALTPSLPETSGSDEVVTLKVPEIPGNMPEMPAKVIALSHSPVLLEKVSAISTLDFNEDEEPNVAEESTDKPSEKSPEDENTEENSAEEEETGEPSAEENSEENAEEEEEPEPAPKPKPAPKPEPKVEKKPVKQSEPKPGVKKKPEPSLAPAKPKPAPVVQKTPEPVAQKKPEQEAAPAPKEDQKKQEEKKEALEILESGDIPADENAEEFAEDEEEIG